MGTVLLSTDFPCAIRRIASPIPGFLPSGTTPQAKPALASPASSEARTTLLRGTTPFAREDAPKSPPSSSSSVGKLNPDPRKFSRERGRRCLIGGRLCVAVRVGVLSYGEKRGSRSSGAEGFGGQSR